MSAARGGASPAPALFFSLPERSPELNSRVADLCRRCFLSRMVSYHPISPGRPQSPSLSLAPSPKWQALPSRGVLPAQEPPRDSAVKVARFSRRRCQPICKRPRIRGRRNARRHYKSDPEEEEEGGGAGRKGGFLSRTRNYGANVEGGVLPE
jgi:hypothetical protein